MVSTMHSHCKQPLERIQADTTLPDQADVVIVGAGMAGASTAWELARAGIRVVLLEKGWVGAEQSSRNWGWVRQQGRDPKELELAVLSLRLWPGLADELQRDIGFEACGVTFVTTNEKELAAWESWCRMGQQYGVDSRMLSPREAADKAGASPGQPWVGGLHTPSDGRAEPARVAPYLAAAAQEAGARVLEQCAVSRFEVTNGRVTHVVTEKGTIACGAVLVAGGAWSRLLLEKHGVAFPQAYVNGSVLQMADVDLPFTGSVVTPQFAIRKTRDQHTIIARAGRGKVELTPALLKHARAFWPTYKVRRKNVSLQLDLASLWKRWRQERRYLTQTDSPFPADRILDPAADPALLNEALAAARQHFPALEPVQPALMWGGCIDSTPDAVPVLSAVRQLPGLYVASGFSGHGFGLTTGVGKVMAAMLMGQPSPIDVTPFDYQRLVDGRRLAPYLLL